MTTSTTTTQTKRGFPHARCACGETLRIDADDLTVGCHDCEWTETLEEFAKRAGEMARMAAWLYTAPEYTPSDE